MDTILLPSNFLTAMILLSIMLITYFASVLVKRIMQKLLQATKQSYAGFFANAAQLFTILIGIIVAVKTTNIDSTILLAMLAIVTAGVSLALDGSVKDVIGGLKIILFGYYKTGDYVSFDDLMGLVLDINLFSTKLHVQPAGLVVVANSTIVDGRITNHSALDSVRYFVNIPFTIPHDRKQILKEILEIVDGHQDTITGLSKIFHKWDGGTESYTIQLEVKEYGDRELVASRVSIAVTEYLESKGIVNS